MLEIIVVYMKCHRENSLCCQSISFLCGKNQVRIKINCPVFIKVFH